MAGRIRNIEYLIAFEFITPPNVTSYPTYHAVDVLLHEGESEGDRTSALGGEGGTWPLCRRVPGGSRGPILFSLLDSGQASSRNEGASANTSGETFLCRQLWVKGKALSQSCVH